MANKTRYIPTLSDLWIYWNVFWIAFKGWSRIFSRQPKREPIKNEGLTAELKTIHLLKDDGWSVFRTQGMPDIIAAKNGEVRLIQVKEGKSRLRKNELPKIQHLAEEFDARAEIWYYKKRGRSQKIPLKPRPVSRIPAP
ncbi:MAG: hypothetical protein OK439_01700 [Thaumarchaeota archaeon]|nr:hypothetical protein [Nitrososphaerota archaeon]